MVPYVVSLAASAGDSVVVLRWHAVLARRERSLTCPACTGLPARGQVSRGPPQRSRYARMLSACTILSRFRADPLPAAPRFQRHLPYPPVDSLAQWCRVMETCRRQPGTLLFAIFDQSLTFDTPPPAGTPDSQRLERLAGISGVHKSDDTNRLSEIGHVLTLPQFHRSHVTTHSATLLLRWLFDDLQLRRVQWFAHSSNVASIRAAERLGFKLEGILVWDRKLPLGKAGESLPGWGEEEAKGPGRHSACLSMGWDDWRRENRERVAALVTREVKPRTMDDLIKVST